MGGRGNEGGRKGKACVSMKYVNVLFPETSKHIFLKLSIVNLT